MSPNIMESLEQQDHGTYKSRVSVDPLAVIYNQGQWRLNKVSALYNLQYSAVKLKQYASRIKQTIVSTITAIPSTKYSIKMEGNSFLKFSKNDSDALTITVYISKSESNTKPKVVYEGILLSWGVSSSVPNAIHLPYMLERGEQKIGAAVKSALGTIFDCKIKQLNFTQYHLLQFGFSFVETETSNFDKRIGFTYSTPKLDQKDKLTIHFEIGDVYLILNGIKEKVTKWSDLVNLTYQTLERQIYHMFVLDITALDLYEVTLPKVAIKNNGTVKMKTPEMVNCVFTMLNEINNVESA